MGYRQPACQGDEFKAGSAAFVGNVDADHTIWLTKNNQIVRMGGYAG